MCVRLEHFDGDGDFRGTGTVVFRDLRQDRDLRQEPLPWFFTMLACTRVYV